MKTVSGTSSRGGCSHRIGCQSIYQPEGDVCPLPSLAAIMHAIPGRVAASPGAHTRGQPVSGGCFHHPHQGADDLWCSVSNITVMPGATFRVSHLSVRRQRPGAWFRLRFALRVRKKTLHSLISSGSAALNRFDHCRPRGIRSGCLWLWMLIRCK